MKRPGSRHYTEEELLMHYLQEETIEVGKEISGHLQECGECGAVLNDYADVVVRIQAWSVPELSQEIWHGQKRILLAHYREEIGAGMRDGFILSLRKRFMTVWNYALDNPLPTLAYVAVAVAFALERTITTFRLERLLPGASEVIALLRQVF